MKRGHIVCGGVLVVHYRDPDRGVDITLIQIYDLTL